MGEKLKYHSHARPLWLKRKCVCKELTSWDPQFCKDGWYRLPLLLVLNDSIRCTGYGKGATTLSIMILSIMMLSIMILSIMILSIECRYAQSRNAECGGTLDKLSIGKMFFDQKTRIQLNMILKTFYCNSSSEYLSRILEKLIYA